MLRLGEFKYSKYMYILSHSLLYVNCVSNKRNVLSWQAANTLETKNSRIDAVKASIFNFSKLNHMTNQMTMMELARFQTVFSVYTRETKETIGAM